MDRKYNCPMVDCNFSSKRKDLLKTHTNEKHLKLLKSCVCGKKMTAAALSRHKKTSCSGKKSIQMEEDARQAIDKLNELPIIIDETSNQEPHFIDGIADGLKQLNISIDEVVSITECNVKIIQLTDGRVACLHDEIALNGTSLSIVPSDTFTNLNA